MTASDRSLLAISKQAIPGTPSAGAYDYLLFTRGAMGANSLFLPLDMEIGGAPVVRDVVKVGYHAVGSFEFIPRPKTLGHFLLGVTGQDTATLVTDETEVYDHAFALAADGFSAPIFTIRAAPGNLWGEVMEDCKITGLSLNWRGANFVRGAVSFMGLEVNPTVGAPGWAGTPDQLAPFITPISKIELPDDTNAACLAGSFTATVATPLDGQWVVGSYVPDALDVVQKAYVLNLTLKVKDSALYNKMVYDGAGAATAWAAALLKEADIEVLFKSAQMIGASDVPYSLKIEGNNTAHPDGNIAWTATPVGLRSGSQVLLNATGVFLADATQTIKLTLTNGISAAY